MRPLEVLTAFLVGACLLSPLIGLPQGTALLAISSLAIVVIVIHLITEKYRWQMVPLYVLSGTIFVVEALGSRRQVPGRVTEWPLAGLILALLILAFAVALPALLPVPRLASPTGTHSVGTRTYVLVDNQRRELYSGRDEPRRFIMQVWYPALPDPGARPAGWMPGAKKLARAISLWLNFPAFFLDHISLARGHAYKDAPADRSAAPFPVLLFSHGWGGFRAQNTYQMQELASRGYLVAGIEHPYGAVVSLFPDGTMININHAALPYQQPGPDYDAAAQRLARQWAGDLSFAIDYLTDINAYDPDGYFTAAVDVQKVGVLGHSTGAGAIVELCASDFRCKAGFAEDAYMTPVSPGVLESGIAQPFVFMFCQVWADDKTSENNRLFRLLESHGRGNHAAMHILGTNHYDFTDLPALSPLAHLLKLKGPIRGSRVQGIINTYSRAFFDWHLKGRPSPLLDGPSQEFPEVIFDSHPDHRSAKGGPVR